MLLLVAILAKAYYIACYIGTSYQVAITIKTSDGEIRDKKSEDDLAALLNLISP